MKANGKARHIDFAVLIATLTPDSLTITLQRHHKTRGTVHVLRSHVQIDLDAVQKMLAGLVEQGMPADYDIKPAIALEEKTAGVGQVLLPVENENANGGQEDSVDHWRAAGSCAGRLGRQGM